MMRPIMAKLCDYHADTNHRDKHDSRASEQHRFPSEAINEKLYIFSV